MPHSGRWICSWRQSTYLQSYQISDDARHWTVYRLDYHSILLHYCFTAVWTLFHFCFTIFTSASWYCLTAVSLFSLLLHYCFMTALLFFHFCFIIVSLLFPYRFTTVSLLFHCYHFRLLGDKYEFSYVWSPHFHNSWAHRENLKCFLNPFTHFDVIYDCFMLSFIMSASKCSLVHFANS